jgi:hypothetical protein
MARKSFAPEEGMWLKGNLHGHTTRSDGRLTPAEVLDGYSSRGYDFVSITDHDLVAAYNHPQLTCIPGFELSGYIGEKPIHLNLWQKGEFSLFEEGTTFHLESEEEMVELVRRCKEHYLIYLNHPAWSLLQSGDLSHVDYLDGIEILNYSTETLNEVEGSIHLWECGLRADRQWLAYGSDDNHNGFTDSPDWPFGNAECDSFGSYLMVKVKEQNVRSITHAIEMGHSYVSEGPHIHEFFVEDGLVHVRCSPVKKIICKGERRNFARRIGEGLTELITPLKGNELFVRVEITDAEGRRAYSNPIYV